MVQRRQFYLTGFFWVVVTRQSQVDYFVPPLFPQNDDFHLALSAELLGIDRLQLQKWICNRKIVTVGEVLIKPLNAREVSSIAERLYEGELKHLYSEGENGEYDR